MGRKKSDNPKDQRLEIRITLEEFIKLSELARDNCCTMAEWIRRQINSQPIAK